MGIILTGAGGWATRQGWNEGAPGGASGRPFWDAPPAALGKRFLKRRLPRQLWGRVQAGAAEAKQETKELPAKRLCWGTCCTPSAALSGPPSF